MKKQPPHKQILTTMKGFTITKVNLVTKEEVLVFDGATKKEGKQKIKELLKSGEIAINGFEYCKPNDKSIEYRLNF